MRARAVARLLLIVWLVLFALLFVPWGDVQDHTHWYKVAWVPFGSRPVKPLDVIGNIVAFVPFGLLLTLAVGRGCRWEWPLGIGAALLLSFGAEAVQMYSHMRFPSATDLTANVIGAGVGVWLARRRFSPHVRSHS